jgi:hypothetical protein
MDSNVISSKGHVQFKFRVRLLCRKHFHMPFPKSNWPEIMVENSSGLRWSRYPLKLYSHVPRKRDPLDGPRIRRDFMESAEYFPGPYFIRDPVTPDPRARKHAGQPQRRNADLPSQRFEVNAHHAFSLAGVIGGAVLARGFDSSNQAESSVRGMTVVKNSMARCRPKSTA